MINSVITTMKELIQIQKKLIRYAEQKRTVLIERKIDELNQLVTEEAVLVKQLEQVENERIQLVDNLLEEHPSLNFNQFVEQLTDDLLKEKIIAQLHTLRGLMADLQTKNRVNERLIEDSLGFVHHMVDQVVKSKQQHFNYQSPLDRQKSQTINHGFFDSKA
ncbi:flagellar export chaperone FlgN [Sporosarcina jiandibaonis]|uniref:flagellar export chaperone FlgN n=1 Tax=Sporosarcina jiandibaonis TaxID=2715535 RepID=UPI0015517417